MPRDFLPILLALVFAVGLGAVLLGLSLVLGRVRGSRTAQTTYESGIPPLGHARERFSIKFYLVAVLFILFDIEIVFLYPWAATYGQLGLLGLVEMLLFVVILVLGLAYAWAKGALEWQ
jgi:NADH-quinone oxidoreductase subunit A